MNFTQQVNYSLVEFLSAVSYSIWSILCNFGKFLYNDKLIILKRP